MAFATVCDCLAIFVAKCSVVALLDLIRATLRLMVYWVTLWNSSCIQSATVESLIQDNRNGTSSLRSAHHSKLSGHGMGGLFQHC